jgi:hypothetical protein
MDFQKYCADFSEWFAVCNFKDKVTPEGYMRLRPLDKEYRSAFVKHFDKVVGLSVNTFEEKVTTEDKELEASRILQKERDMRRIHSRETRQVDRYIYSMEDLEKSLREVIHTYKFSDKIPSKRTPDPEAPELIIQVTDTHFNEFIDMACNKYDFYIASARLRKYADKILKYAADHNITNAVLAFTGDLLNSDRRKEEVVAQITNRASACYVVVDILQQFIQHLSTQLDLRVLTVSGNESRIDFELGFTERMLSNNFDNIVFHQLRRLFEGSSIKFEWGNSFEYYTKVNGHDILFIHGMNVKDNVESVVQQMMGRFSNTEAVHIRYIILGHKHSSRVGDTYARGSSLCGANPYSKYALNLISRAAQNIFLVYSDGSVDGIKIDLQNAPEEGYAFTDLGDMYNSTSHHKITKVR